MRLGMKLSISGILVIFFMVDEKKYPVLVLSYNLPSSDTPQPEYDMLVSDLKEIYGRRLKVSIQNESHVEVRISRGIELEVVDHLRANGWGIIQVE
jgi:hypothetical protein